MKDIINQLSESFEDKVRKYLKAEVYNITKDETKIEEVVDNAMEEYAKHLAKIVAINYEVTLFDSKFGNTNLQD